LAELKKKGIIG